MTKLLILYELHGGFTVKLEIESLTLKSGSLHSSYVTWANQLPKPQCLLLQNGNNNTLFTGLLWGLNEITM